MTIFNKEDHTCKKSLSFETVNNNYFFSLKNKCFYLQINILEINHTQWHWEPCRSQRHLMEVGICKFILDTQDVLLFIRFPFSIVFRIVELIDFCHNIVSSVTYQVCNSNGVLRARFLIYSFSSRLVPSSRQEITFFSANKLLAGRWV